VHPPPQDGLLEPLLLQLLGDIDAEALAVLRQHLEWVELPGGATLMAQGEVGDALYISVSGRLRAYVRDDDGIEHLVREMARGQVIGEMALYTEEPRSATVVAIRDSVLVRLSKAQFQRLLMNHAQATVALTRQIIRRLQTVQSRSELARPVTMALVPVSEGVDVKGFAEALSRELGRLVKPEGIVLVDATRIDHELADAGAARRAPASLEDSAALNRRIALALDRLEVQHDFVLLLADATATPWTERCCRRSDELLLLADARQTPALHPSEAQFLMPRDRRSEAAEILVLLHTADTRCPSGTRQWLARRPLTGHLHVRPALARDMARLARLQSRNAVGIVFAGGGARGLAHLGVMQALAARGIELDCVGGTSIGAVMAAVAATDRPMDEVMAVTRRAFLTNPTGDYNWLPLMSLIRGRRLRRVVDEAATQLVGQLCDAEDLWKPFFCVASNYSRASEQVLRHGPLTQLLQASMAIPGALPPVLMDGELLCDGGTFNNFPVDVMRGQRGLGRVIGVDLSSRKLRRLDIDALPTPWALLRDRMRPRAARRIKLPSLVAYLMNVTVMVSTSRQRQAQRLTDLYLNPPLERVGMLQWHRFDSIVDQGRQHAEQVLAALPAPVRRSLGVVDTA
jgi:NTE family protein